MLLIRSIIVEDPSPEFQRIRDLLDCKRCLETPEVMQTITQSNCVNGQIISEKSSAIRFREISRTKLKLNRCQSRRVYEILRLFLLPRTDEYVKSFSDALTKRATAYFQVCCIIVFVYLNSSLSKFNVNDGYPTYS